MSRQVSTRSAAARPKPDSTPLAQPPLGASECARLEFTRLKNANFVDLQPQALGLTYWFDADALFQETEASQCSLRVRFTGLRQGLDGPPGPLDRFVVFAALDNVRPSDGRVALTQRVTGRAAGRWEVVADAFVLGPTAGGAPLRPLRRTSATGRTVYLPFAAGKAPGVVVGAWPGLVALGVVVALVVQSVLSRTHGLPVMPVLALGVMASVVGLLGAKLYYRLTHREEKSHLLATGMSVQGFVIAAVLTFLVGGTALSVPFPHLLDTTVPALLAGQAIGRLGCFFGGCCSGLPTASRWGVWTSDRRVGQRRIPVQLIESGIAGALAIVTFLVVVQGPPAVDGLTFVAGFGVYTIARQLLFPLRVVPRKTRHGVRTTSVLATLAVLAAMTLLLVVQI